VSPAAGVTAGTATAAGIGAPKPPSFPVQPPPAAPGTPAPPPPTPGAVPGGRHTQPTPNLPEGVRQKLEQMKGLNKK
jgi:hypothetical protein